MEAQPLVIDRAGVGVPLSEGELRAWATGARVFISSVIAGLETERRSVAEAIRSLDAKPVWFEEFGGRDDDPEGAYEAEVDSSDIYVGILGTRYGRQDARTSFSATHAEYLRAVARGLRICVWVLDGGLMEGHQRSFLDEVRTFYVTESASSAEHLAQRVTERLRAIAAEDAAPWCKLGPIVARATEIVDDGQRLRVTLEARDADVTHALLGLRPDRFHGGADLVVTYRDVSVPAVVDTVEQRTTAGRTSSVVIGLQHDHRTGLGGDLGAGRWFSSFSMGGRTYSSADLTEIALREALLGGPNPLEGSASMARLDDPLGPLRSTSVPEEALRSIARLLLVEALVGTGRAQRLTAFRLGPRSPGGRRVEMSWEERPAFTGEAPERRHLEGQIDL